MKIFIFNLGLNFLAAFSIVSSVTTQNYSTESANRSKSFQLKPYLAGKLVELRPLKPEDWERLYGVAADPLIWEQHPARDRYQEEVFKEFFREALASGGAFVIIDRQTHEIIGSSRYFGWDSGKSEIEIGWTFLARAYWGGRYNAEVKRLMLDHAFKFVKSVVFVIGVTNLRSQKALKKIGGVIIARRNKTDLQGRTIENVVYQIKKPTNITSTSNVS